MRQETLKALKALSRKENRLQPPKIETNKKAYKRHRKHKTDHREEFGLFCF